MGDFEEKGRQFCNKTACSTSSSCLSKSTTGARGNPDPESSSLMTWRGAATCQRYTDEQRQDHRYTPLSFQQVLCQETSFHCWGWRLISRPERCVGGWGGWENRTAGPSCNKEHEVIHLQGTMGQLLSGSMQDRFQG